MPHPTSTEPHTTTPQAAVITVRQRLGLAVLLTASFTLAIDFSILNVALPVIGKDIGFSLGNLQWIATSFALCAAGFTLFFGRIADLFGRRRLFLSGIALLGAASLAGALAQEPTLLIISRIAQGIATAMVTPSALSLLTTAFPEGPARDRALGLNGALMAAGFTTGAILGGVLTDLLSWRWAFGINVIVAVVVLVIAPRVLVESRPADRPRLDVPGAITITLGLLAVVYGLTNAGQHSWTSVEVWLPLLVGVAFLAGFWFIERRSSQPLVPVAILRRRTVGWGNFAGLIAFATETSLVFPLTLYLQNVLGFSPLSAGMCFAVLGVGTVLGGLAGPRVIGRFGSKNAIVIGFCIQGAATAALILLGPDPRWVVMLLVLTFIGGFANLIAIVGYVVTATSGLPDNEQGLATGLVTMSQQIGMTLGLPIMSAIVAAHTLPAHAGPTLGGITSAVAINAGLCFAAAALIAVFLDGPARKRA